MAQTNPGSLPVAYLALITATLFWGANVVFGKLAVGEISPMLLVFCRWTGVVSLLLIFANKYIRKDWPVIRANLKYVAIMGTVGFTVFNAIFYVAAHSTDGLNIGILQGSIPIFVLIGVYFAYSLRITPLQVIGVIITLAGVVVIVSKGELATLASLNINWGDGLMLIACLFYAAYTVGLRAKPATSALGFFTGLAIFAFFTSIPLLAFEIASGQVIWPTPTGWFVVVGATLLPSFLSQVCFIKGVEIIGPGRAGVFANLVPIFGSIFVVMFLGEVFSTYHALALLLVLGGIALSELGKAKV